MFSKEIYFSLFGSQNRELWPLQVIFWIVCCFLLVRFEKVFWSRTQEFCLAFLWFFIAFIFHFNHYASIQLAAPYFGALFILQGLLIIGSAFSQMHKKRSQWLSRVGQFLIVISLFYPLAILSFGERDFEQVTFLASGPDPLAVGTLGFLLFKGQSLYLGGFACLWLLISFLTHLAMGSQELWLLATVLILTSFSLVMDKILEARKGKVSL